MEAETQAFLSSLACLDQVVVSSRDPSSAVVVTLGAAVLFPQILTRLVCSPFVVTLLERLLVDTRRLEARNAVGTWAVRARCRFGHGVEYEISYGILLVIDSWVCLVERRRGCKSLLPMVHSEGDRDPEILGGVLVWLRKGRR